MNNTNIKYKQTYYTLTDVYTVQGPRIRLVINKGVPPELSFPGCTGCTASRILVLKKMKKMKKKLKKKFEKK